MPDDQTHNLDKAAIYHLEILNSFLTADPEMIELMTIEEVTEELSEIGVSLDTAKGFPARIKACLTPRRSLEIEARLKTLFEVGKEGIFEEGVENEFSSGLISLINEYGTDVVSKLADFIMNGSINEEIAAEALRWLGRLDHPPSYRERQLLLEEALSSPSVRIRDAASVGLATLGDRQAIPRLRQAIQREVSTELREDMQQILESLEGTP